MIGTSIPEYIFVRVCIWGLRAITPLSIFYCSFSIADPPSSGFRKFLLAWAMLETAFWLLVFLPRKRTLQAPAAHPPPLGKQERKELFWKCWECIPNPEYYLSKWFLGARSYEIRQDNVREFFRWALLNRGDGHVEEKTLSDEQLAMKLDEEAELDEYVDGTQTLMGRPIEPGRGPATSLRLTVDKINMLHRPAFWYLLVFIVDTFTSVRLRLKGFLLYRTHMRSTLSIFPPRVAPFLTRQLSSAPDLPYWYRPHTSKTRLPVLFLHGIGIGLYPYIPFLEEINKGDPRNPEDGDIGIIAVELLPVSFRITPPILDRDDIPRQINLILERHGFDKVVLVSHSYGSVVTTHLLQNSMTAPKIGPMLLVDPVTFLLHLPDIAYNFTARRPHGANEHLLYYIGSTDMMVAHTLARYFFWAHNILWKDDLRGRDVTVSLAGRDLIVDTETTGKYVAGVDLKSESSDWKNRGWKGSGIETLWWKTCDHAQVFDRPEGTAKLAEIVRRYAEKTGGDEDEDLL
ncbi:hypothetical protein K458DRAFT_346364 [Lentithecium fluviatile CBS 122367]|uniref:AB hydrolase-1 domain-containing protein n=1 Tax=Lentithecium fluviatile CBS 122367 TaxID=1168545 RepID=A0A6G1IP36_9PLEO|nr:hypothetical protein K458DRAFT_346364 [Lentithecium fluviatile CBS 122367]